jgi:hypothetical protein
MLPKLSGSMSSGWHREHLCSKKKPIYKGKNAFSSFASPAHGLGCGAAWSVSHPCINAWFSCLILSSPCTSVHEYICLL